MDDKAPLISKIINTTVIVAGLGYFVDIYDLQLFNIIGKESIMSSNGLNIKDPEKVAALFDNNLFYWQMAGMLLGGLLWGILGDIKGRKSILFGSILMYSLANIANAFVTTIPQYQFVRLFAGLGLAGELGAAITLVSEVMTKENRGYGTAVIVTLGALGAVAAALVKEYSLNFGIAGFEPWQSAYIIGGILGLLLLFLRFGTFESGMFEQVQLSTAKKGNFKMFFTDTERLKRYIYCILIGLPVWYVIGILIKLAPRFASEVIHIEGDKLSTSYPIMYAYIGLSVGDFISGWLSQYFRSRKKVILGYLIANILLVITFLSVRNISAGSFYFLCFLLGAATGYWALFVTVASEQFGTNIRATATTTVPNFVRGAVIPIGLGFFFFVNTAHWSLVSSAIIVGAVCVGLAVFSTLKIEETFGKDLDYTE
ncbi:MAG: MFS transporter [Bacteroidia bacterium]|nr:MFS transporter [Bacteroidia bacterium]